MPEVICQDQRRHTFAPNHTALLMIDMQRDFFTPPEETAALHEILASVELVLAAARNASVHVVHTREGYAHDGSDVNAFKRALGYVGRPGPNGPFLIRGSPGHDFFDGWEPHADETVIDKAGFSGFYRSALDEELRSRAITHLLLAGVTTQSCVHLTLRDAVERGYFCLTLDDCCAAVEPAVHQATMRIIRAENDLFGWIGDSAALLAAFARC
ncbi:MAG: cysteine hydrolase [Gammaproteobacteria bacterium]|nr:cysteine hydrolase [Gammaproteobacteria bacterium]